eukprot:7003387-Prorocentrum_lima.AAC.1
MGLDARTPIPLTSASTGSDRAFITSYTNASGNAQSACPRTLWRYCEGINIADKKTTLRSWTQS